MRAFYNGLSPQSRLVVIFVAWYSISSGYSILAKKGMMLDPDISPVTLSLLQFVAGVVAVVLASGFNTQPLRRTIAAGGPIVALIALGNFVGAYLTCVSMSQGSVAITYIVKATEPLFAVALSFVLMGSSFSRQTLLSLLPICIGLVLACSKPSPAPATTEPGEAAAAGAAAAVAIAGLGAFSAIGSNVGMGLRNVLGKVRMKLNAGTSAGAAQGQKPSKRGSAAVGKEEEGEDRRMLAGREMSPSSADEELGEAIPAGKQRSTAAAEDASEPPAALLLFGAMSFYAMLYCAALAVLDWRSMEQTVGMPVRWLTGDGAALAIALAAASHAAYTICSFTVLSLVTPATHAISNSMKHVTVIVLASLLLGNPPTVTQGIGAAIAIGGVYMYNRAQLAEKAAAAAAEAEKARIEAETGRRPDDPPAARPAVLAFLSSWQYAVASAGVAVVALATFVAIPA